MTTTTNQPAGPSLRVETAPDGVALLTFDAPGESVNVISPAMGEELRAAWPTLMSDPAVKAVVLTSAKKDNFFAGAQIEYLQSLATVADATRAARDLQKMFDEIQYARKPVVVAIHGGCMGGGTEMALACHYRVASTDKKTKLGLPEILIGVFPGGGGTQRLPRLIGVQAALDMILTGREVAATKALRMGLVDEAVPQAILLEVARKRALEFAGGKRLPRRGVDALVDKLRRGKPDPQVLTALALEQNPVGRMVLFGQASKMAEQKSRGNYPAVAKAIQSVRYGLDNGMERGLLKEAELFGECCVTDVSHQLTTIFFAQRALKKDPGVDDAAVKPHDVKLVGLLGGGLMGGGIAYVTTALARLPVRIKERDDAGLGRGLSYVRQVLDQRVRRRSISRLERDEQMARVTGSTEYRGFRKCDVVVEAVFEDLEVKHRVVRELEAVVKPTCVLASNTSTLPISSIAEASARPENVVGMHYFSPVEKMPLLEVIRGKRTCDVAVATAVALGKKQGKTVIVVNDGPGFYTSRILAPYLNEAAWLLSEGADIHAVDEALVDWGFPVGPLQLIDEIGLDVVAHAAKTMLAAFGEKMTQPEGLQRILDDKRLGRKNRRGFYLYPPEDGKKKAAKRVDETIYDLSPQGRRRKALPVDDVVQRLNLRFCNEAALCLQEGIVRGPRDGDVGAIFGLGYPPFRGGPFRWMDAVGAAEVVRRLRIYEQRLGVRFTPAPILLDMAQKGTTFHRS
jgi:3-hydroxyacyl-CoA dehydrogenase/enoyl-CoA hydratase/3-hydroxybutyryl-CoA epimerase